MDGTKAREFECRFGAFTRVENGRVVRCDGAHVCDADSFPEEVRERARLTGAKHALLVAVGKKRPDVRFYALVTERGTRVAFALLGVGGVVWRGDDPKGWEWLKRQCGIPRSRDDV